jgi:hypothetical protein
MILDINAFIGKWPYWPVAENGLDYGCDRAAICSTRSVFVNWEDGNRETARACREDGRLLPFACLGTLELSHGRAARDYDFGAYAAQGFRGIRLYPQHHTYHPLYQAWVDQVLEEARARRWPVLLPLRIIMNWGMPLLDLGVIETLVKRHPAVTWILAGINYFHELQLATMLLLHNPNVHIETSCIMGFHAIAKLVEQCGSGQILFGTGAPIQHGRANLEKILRAKIADADREAILGANACRLLALD